jgi:sialic acid synthase SpsE
VDRGAAAAEAGADAIKLQTYTADTITLNADADDFQIRSGPWRGRSLWELYQEAHTPWEWHQAIFDRARKLNLIPFSTPFGIETIMCGTINKNMRFFYRSPIIKTKSCTGILCRRS